MRILLLSLIVSLCSTGWADSVSGYFSLSSGRYYVSKTSDGSAPVEIKALDQDTAAILQKLSNGDFINGTGQTVNSTIVLSGIDFVGLKVLLGTWVGDSAWFQFQDFSSVSAQIPAPVGWNKQTAYQYSIIPSVTDGSWRIFISDSAKVQTAKLTISADQVLVEFDPAQGTSSLQLQLNKAPSQ